LLRSENAFAYVHNRNVFICLESCNFSFS